MHSVFTFMKIFVAGTALWLLLPFTIFSQCMTYPVGIQDRINNSQLIIEGKIISQVSFWNSSQDFIYTSNVIDVYKVFKGTITSNQVEIITEGGIVGNELIKAEPALEFKPDDIGVFFGVQAIQLNPNSTFPPSHQFEGYASNQSFIKYDMLSFEAADPYTVFNDIVVDIYQNIAGTVGQTYTEIIPFTLQPPSNLGPGGNPSPMAFPTITGVTSPSTAGTFS